MVQVTRNDFLKQPDVVPKHSPHVPLDGRAQRNGRGRGSIPINQALPGGEKALCESLFVLTRGRRQEAQLVRLASEQAKGCRRRSLEQALQPGDLEPAA